MSANQSINHWNNAWGCILTIAFHFPILFATLAPYYACTFDRSKLSCIDYYYYLIYTQSAMHSILTLLLPLTIIMTESYQSKRQKKRNNYRNRYNNMAFSNHVCVWVFILYIICNAVIQTWYFEIINYTVLNAMRFEWRKKRENEWSPEKIIKLNVVPVRFNHWVYSNLPSWDTVVVRCFFSFEFCISNENCHAIRVWFTGSTICKHRTRWKL